ncbi:MAG: hypothetical protein JWM87_3445 [Candidatus Eremiobacteraeota bacterium]|nr:hypothetical protein [Candidatus Eremiobacteraeota bacterium]
MRKNRREVHRRSRPKRRRVHVKARYSFIHRYLLDRALLVMLFAFVCTARAALAAPPVLAAGDVLVLDARTAAPLANATISAGDRMLARTGANGVAALAGSAHDGDTLSVRLSGYASLSLRFALGAANVARLAPLQSIGGVSTTASAPKDAVAASVQTIAAGTLLDAIAGKPGVAVVRGTGSDGPEVVSIRGQDPGKTGVTIDGIRVSRPGAATDFRFISTDLAESVTVSTFGDPASPAGNVDIRTIEPARAPRLTLAESAGGFGLAQSTLAYSQTLGKLAVTLAHARRDGATPLSNVVVQDESDLRYPSEGQRRQYGDLLKLRYQPGPRLTVTLSENITNTSTLYWCGEFTTALPCGIGPANLDTARFSAAGLLAQYKAGAFEATLRAGRVVTLVERDFDNRTLFGTAYPLGVEQRLASSPQQITLARRAGKHRLYADVQSNGSHTDFVPKRGSAFLTESHTSSPFTSATLGDTFTGERVTHDVGLSLARYDGRNAPELRARTTVKLGRDSRIAAGVSLGSATPLVNAVETFGDPLNLRVDCPGRLATSIAPADAIAGQSEQRYELSYTSTHAVASTTLTAYVDRERGQPAYVYVPAGAALPPPGFLAAAAALWAHPEVCGSQPFAADRVYFNTLLSSVGKNVAGLEYQGRIPLGRAVVLNASFALLGAHYATRDPRLAGAQSFAYDGARVVGVPAFKARAQLSGVLGPGRVEWALEGQYFGTNNERLAQPYGVVNAGMAFALGRGKAVLALTNALNTGGGNGYADITHAQAYPTLGGDSVLFPVRPLLPRALSAGYRIDVGRR